MKLKLKIFCEDDYDGFDILDEIVERPQPIHVYAYEDSDGILWWIISELEVNPDDMETNFNEKIDAYKRKNSRASYTDDDE